MQTPAYKGAPAPVTAGLSASSGVASIPISFTGVGEWLDADDGLLEPAGCWTVWAVFISGAHSPARLP